MRVWFFGRYSISSYAQRESAASSHVFDCSFWGHLVLSVCLCICVYVCIVTHVYCVCCMHVLALLFSSSLYVCNVVTIAEKKL